MTRRRDHLRQAKPICSTPSEHLRFSKKKVFQLAGIVTERVYTVEGI
ncbi:hypothetical protein BFV94_4413 [Alteromonas macleodii]|uniref:Uncharacterized protein n=1 Tax=Alteromonas macleodii TaxID=28108 RepID=A0AB36FMT9_ALTMA|nr:hypothetical protein BFV95_4770 [Alteromonas macleodii]OES25560.1 hypothetical protein BFV94_4413 [Alteromonas macleodii]OES25861.1 hypothetical protein BFV93_4324 [Alteromonas macleodii]OES38617.1 hypothetical protein BFV96_4728 [Alteromonas macleodii]